jgi:hypothetical protein
VWKKTTPIPGLDENEWGLCAGGKTIRYSHHGDRSSEFGWEMDHHPVAGMFGGGDHVANLRPLHWSLNALHVGILGALTAKG